MTQIAERKLNNYTVVYGTYECWECSTRGYETGISYCDKCQKRTDMGPVVETLVVKAATPYNAQAKLPGRFIAVFEGALTPVLLG